MLNCSDLTDEFQFKGYVRRAKSRQEMGKLIDPLDDIKNALKIFPNDPKCMYLKKELLEKLALVYPEAYGSLGSQVMRKMKITQIDVDQIKDIMDQNNLKESTQTPNKLFIDDSSETDGLSNALLDHLDQFLHDE
jgi:hypothetical protein